MRGETLPKILMEETERVLGVKTDSVPTLLAAFKKGRGLVSAPTDLRDCLLSETYPFTYATRYEPNASEVSFRSEIRPLGKALQSQTKGLKTVF